MIRLLVYSLVCVIMGICVTAGAGSVLARTLSVVIDHRYDADLVKLACLPDMEQSCVDGKVRDLTTFEDTIRALLAQGCGDISVVRTGEPADPYWDLLIDYNSKTFRLIKVHDPANFSFYTEGGSASAIAKKICSMIKQKGAAQNSN